MRISGAFPSDYLKAADLQGRNVRVIMSHVEMKDIGGDHKPILFFQGKDKGMVLNKTNANNISAVYGDDTDDWNGKELILFETMVDFQGKSVPAIRVRSPQPKDRPQVRQSSAEMGREPQRQTGGISDSAMDDEIPF